MNHMLDLLCSHSNSSLTCELYQFCVGFNRYVDYWFDVYLCCI